MTDISKAYFCPRCGGLCFWDSWFQGYKCENCTYIIRKERICPSCGSLMQRRGVGLGKKKYYYYECLDCLYQTLYREEK